MEKNFMTHEEFKVTKGAFEDGTVALDSIIKAYCCQQKEYSLTGFECADGKGYCVTVSY